MAESWDESRMWIIKEMNRMAEIMERVVGRLDAIENTLAVAEERDRLRQESQNKRVSWLASLWAGAVTIIVELVRWIASAGHPK